MRELASSSSLRPQPTKTGLSRERHDDAGTRSMRTDHRCDTGVQKVRYERHERTQCLQWRETTRARVKRVRSGWQAGLDWPGRAALPVCVCAPAPVSTGNRTLRLVPQRAFFSRSLPLSGPRYLLFGGPDRARFHHARHRRSLLINRSVLS